MPRRPVSPFAAHRPDGTVWATLWLASVFVLVFVAEYALGGADNTIVLMRLGAISGPEILEQGQWWRLLSGSMLHGSLGHLAGNLYGWLIFGSFVEMTLGRSRMLVAYAFAVLCGSLASASQIGSDLSVGASGGVFGLLGITLALTWRAGHLIPADTRAGLRKNVVFLLVFNGFVSLVPGVDLWAHLGGLVGGFVLAFSGLLIRGLPASPAAVSAPLVEPVANATPVELFDTPGAPDPQADHSTGLLQRGYQWLAAGAAVLLAAAVPWAALQTDAAELLGRPPLTRVNVANSGVSLNVPKGAASRATITEQHGQFTHMTWGDTKLDPVTVSLLVWRLQAPVADPRGMLANESFKPVQEGKGGPAQVIDIDGRAFLHRTEGEGTHPWPRWRGYIGQHRVDLLVRVMPEAADKWNGLPEQILRSIQQEAGATTQ
jgi:rhomboid protease GluP